MSRTTDAALLELVGDVRGLLELDELREGLPVALDRPYRFSDVVTPSELHATGLYREFYAGLGIEHQIAFVINTAPETWVAMALSRRSQDFSDAERDLLDRARPHLVQLYRNAIAYTALVDERRAHQTANAITGRLIDAGLTPARGCGPQPRRTRVVQRRRRRGPRCQRADRRQAPAGVLRDAGRRCCLEPVVGRAVSRPAGGPILGDRRRVLLTAALGRDRSDAEGATLNLVRPRYRGRRS